MPTFEDKEPLSLVRAKINDAIVAIEGTNSFSRVAVAGQGNVDADGRNSTLKLEAGTNVTITTNASTDTVTISSTGGGVSDGDKGDITVSGSGTVWTIDNGAVDLATKVSGVLPASSFNDTAHGARAGGTLHADATTSVSGFMSGADKTKLNGVATGANLYVHPNHTGDVTSVADGATTIAANAVTNAKLAQAVANTLKGNNTGATANVADLTTSQVKTMLAITTADVSGLGSMATQNSGSVNITGGTVSTSLGNLTVASLGNTTAIPINTSSSAVGQLPISAVIWHDLLRFLRYYTATVEVSDNLSTWTSSTLDKRLFSGIEDQVITVIADSATRQGIRWTFNNSSLSWSSAEWLVLGVTYSATARTMQVLVESSADGSTWTQRHLSSGLTDNAKPIFYRLSSYSGDPYLRVTITRTAGTGAVSLSSMRLLTSRWGDQGRGREAEFPYVWDENGNITGLGNLVATGTVTGTNLSGTNTGDQSIFQSIAVSGQTTVVADTTADTLTLAAGTGIGITTNAATDTITITNSAPDQTVSLTQGGTVTVSGTYPSFTISGAATNISYTAATRALASSTGTGFTFPLFSSTDAGLVPASGGGTTNFLRADGTWATAGAGPTADPLRLSANSAATPTYSFTTATDMGMYAPSTTQLGWSVGGVQRMTLDNNSGFSLISDAAFYPIVSFENTAAASANGSIFRGQKRRGAGAAQSGDTSLLFAAQGHDGAGYFDLANIRFAVDNTVSTGIVPGRMVFTTTDTAGAQQERFRVNSAGAWGLGSGVDYGLPGEVLSSGGSATVAPKWEYPGKPTTISAAGASITTTSTVIAGITLEAGEVVAGSEYEFEVYLSCINTTTATNLVLTLGQNATIIHTGTVALGTTANASPGRPVLARGRITFYSTTTAIASLWIKSTSTATIDSYTAITTPVTVSTAAGNTLYLGGSVSGATSSIIPRSAMARKVK